MTVVWIEMVPGVAAEVEYSSMSLSDCQRMEVGDLARERADMRVVMVAHTSAEAAVKVPVDSGTSFEGRSRADWLELWLASW